MTYLGDWKDWEEKSQRAREAAIPEDIKRLLDPGQNDKPDSGPIRYLWIYDPVKNKVTVEHNEGKHPAFRITHKDLEPFATHEDAVRGYAYKIKGGWRICDRESREVADPYVVSRVVRKLEGKPDPEPGVHRRYHGLPS
jgi:hypothetical protein